MVASPDWSTRAAQDGEPFPPRSEAHTRKVIRRIHTRSDTDPRLRVTHAQTRSLS
jgi:hypothetical protein